MNLTELKTRPAAALVELGESLGVENLRALAKQDIIFSILKGTCQEWRRYLRRWRAGDLAGRLRLSAFFRQLLPCRPDDIYVSPSQIRRFNLRTGDTVSGLIRPPKEGERYFALLKVGQINHDAPENARSKVLFENLTPLFPKDRLRWSRATAVRKI